MFQKPDEVYRIKRTLCVQTDHPAPGHQDNRINLICLLKTAQDTAETTEQFLFDTFCPALAAAACVRTLELSLFDAQSAADESASEEVSAIHAKAFDPDLGRYTGMLEIELDSAATWRSVVAGALARIRAETPASHHRSPRL